MGESGHQLGGELECLCMHTWQGGSSEWGRCEVKQRGWLAQSAAGNQTDLQPPHLLSALPAGATGRRQDSRAAGSTQTPPPFLGCLPLQPLEVKVKSDSDRQSWWAEG